MGTKHKYSKEAMLRAIEDDWYKTQEVLESDTDYPFEDDVDVSDDDADDLEDDEFED